MKSESTPSRFVSLPLYASLALLAASGAAPAQNIVEHEVYVKMDYWVSPSQQSAEAWHFDPDNNNQWTQLPNDPMQAIPRARFTIEDLLRDEWITREHVWFLGVPGIRVVGGEPGNFQNLSGVEAYSEMIDVMVIRVENLFSGLTVLDPCGTRIWPIATGSEMMEYWLDPHPDNEEEKHYGIRLHREEVLASAAWKWKNPGGVDPYEDVYIEFKLRFDYDKVNENYTYSQCGVSWISAAGGCDYNFCLTDSTATKSGSPFSLGTNDPIVVAVPHTLDHATNVRLYRREGGQDTLLVERTPINSNNYHTAHKCDPDGAEIQWHTHTSGAYGHLVVDGYTQWQGNQSPGSGDGILTKASYNVPAHSTAAPVNHRGLYIVFWERLIQP